MTRCKKHPNDIPFFEGVDLFCGAGGVTSGIQQAIIDQLRIAKILACVNHDTNAIASHKANHRCRHFIENIVTMNERKLPKNRFLDDTLFFLWASMECTNFSNAKGGKTRDADSRTLAEHLLRYIEWCQPDYIFFENVREFMSWGPLIVKTKKVKVEGVMTEYCPLHWNKEEQKYEPVMVPESRTKGKDYLRWVESIRALGYEYDFRMLNSANYGEHTSRVRMFGVFAKKGLPIVFPEATHAKNPKDEALFGKKLKKWLAVKRVLDLQDEGESIFSRKKKKGGPLDPNSLKRVYKGLVKFVAGGEDKFLSKAFSGESDCFNISLEGPSGAVTTIDHHQLLSASFLMKYMGNDPKTGDNHGKSLDDPAPVIATSNRLGLVQAQQFMSQRNGQDQDRSSSLDGPAKTVTATGGNMELVQPEFIVQSYGGDANKRVYGVDRPARVVTAHDNQSVAFLAYYNGNCEPTSLEQPAGAITTKDRFHIINSNFLNVEYGKSIGRDINSPCPTITGNPKINLVDIEQFIMNQFSGGGELGDLEQPAHSITGVPKANLVSPQQFLVDAQFGNGAQSIDDPAGTITASRHYHYLVNPQYNNSGSDVNNPCPVVIAMQGKKPLSLVSVETGQVHIIIYESDNEWIRRIKIFMAAYGIVDIKMRMLKIKELLRIQGFPENYKLMGSQEDQKKFIGNAVTPKVPKHMIECLARANKGFSRKRWQETQLGYTQLKIAA
jgi:DNA (cytosine-5)-methyltransferase 1